MKVFVTGATGYIGYAVATALARNGHDVYGLARTEAKGSRLAAREVTPVLGALDDPKTFEAAVSRSQVLINCAVEYSPRMWELHDATLNLFLADTVRPRLVIATSGVWVYGSTGDEAADETTPVRPPALVEPRPASDRKVLEASRGALRTVVIRPGCVYGGTAGLTATWFDTALSAGAARVIGDGSNRWSMIHIDDLADLYVKVAESSLSGEILNANDRSRFTVLECARAASLAAGAGGKVELVPVETAAREMGPFAECLALDQHVDSTKAVRRLSWQPRHGGFADGAARYFAAWRASAAR